MNDTVVNKPLLGLNVVITRPLTQAKNLSALIEIAGGNPVLFPTLEIVEPTDKQGLLTILQEIRKFDIAIFTSVNAVASLPPEQLNSFKHLKILAVGSTTAQALAELKLDVIFPEAEFSSEALLKMPILTVVAGKRIAIFTGEGGRDLLIENLSRRGANVSKVMCYRRVCPQLKVTDIGVGWRKLPVHIIVSTSNESLSNLRLLCQSLDLDWLLAQRLLVISQRMVAHARELGFKLPLVVATQANDLAILDALIAWYTSALH